MSKPVDDYKEYIVEDVCAGIPDVSAKRMFGGWGLYQAGSIFAIITGDDEVCFKADAALAKIYKAAGATQFIYEGHKKPVAMPYWRVPESVLEDRETIAQWVMDSAEVTRSSKK